MPVTEWIVDWAWDRAAAAAGWASTYVSFEQLRAHAYTYARNGLLWALELVIVAWQRDLIALALAIALFFLIVLCWDTTVAVVRYVVRSVWRGLVAIVRVCRKLAVYGVVFLACLMASVALTRRLYAPQTAPLPPFEEPLETPEWA